VWKKHPFTVLIVDDEPAMLDAVKRIFRNSPYRILVASGGLAALEISSRHKVDVIILDYKMPDMDGLTVLKKVKAAHPSIQVLMLTGQGGVREAVAAIKLGAIDFLLKPFETETLLAKVGQCYRIWRLEMENRALKDGSGLRFEFQDLIGDCPVMLRLKRQIIQIAASDAPVLIQGATGTGKELVARAIHVHSSRSTGPFVPVDCGALNESTMGSELFGHVKGAFTGAVESTTGLIRAADGGTLFLDEVGELPLSMQVKLLRTLQEREVRPIGSSRHFKVDVRVTAATNQDLEKAVAAGSFRQDLYYRLNVVGLRVPALAERMEDLPLLVNHFLNRFSEADRSLKCSPRAMECLRSYCWPGNVRELENAVRHAAAFCSPDVITVADLPEQVRQAAESGSGSGRLLPAEVTGETMADYEIAAIRNALARTGGHRRKAARLLGIGEATLYRKLKRYNLHQVGRK